MILAATLTHSSTTTVEGQVLTWVEILAGIIAIIAGLYAFTLWARKQFRDAIREDVKPMFDAIGISVNNVHPGEAPLIQQVREAREHAAKAATAAQLAASMSESNGNKVDELSTRVGALEREVMLEPGHGPLEGGRLPKDRR